MPDTNNQVLIREYADRNSEWAFAELVDQHIRLVYSVAVRYVGNIADAQDVTQAVFVILARKAAGLRQRTTLTGWLYETTRLTAAALLKRRSRQQAREHEAYMQTTLNDSETSGVWRQLAPVLEEAMGRLNEKERTLLALRLFENKTAAETAALLGMRTDAAHKGTARALEKLRRFFLGRGIDSSTALMAETISANSVQAVPAALAKSVIAAAMVHGAVANSSTLALIKGALKMMAWSKAKTAVATCAVLLMAAVAGTMTVENVQMRGHPPKLQPRVAGIVGPIIKISPNGVVSVVHMPTNLPASGGPRRHFRTFTFSFKKGASHDAILQQLEQMHAVILSDTPELLRAETAKTPKISAAAELHFKFSDGKLANISIFPKGIGAFSVINVSNDLKAIVIPMERGQ